MLFQVYENTKDINEKLCQKNSQSFGLAIEMEIILTYAA
ncbi:hypothetical protein Ataiwa_29580 [Algoriphagus taiwanensis]|uniref:Uncharacterized protein n=1 Tax=Algoriphagus taiwanensis TaxID=1445656 RepID=A0ABQ6Q3C8_9BACT|nr:hypothetical protein Ataiwa_29580 [Algoriphagus taiwanensis]